MSDQDLSYLPDPNPDTFAAGARPLAEARRAPLATEVAAGLSGAVALTRAWDCCGICRSIRLFIDEEQAVGAVGYGCRRVFYLAPGAYSLSVEMDWCCSRPYDVEIRPGELVELEASLRWRGLLWWLSPFVTFIFPERLFVIRPVHRPEDRSLHRGLWEGVRVVAGAGFVLCLVFSLLVLFAALLG
jgi:hypothetical protein